MARDPGRRLRRLSALVDAGVLERRPYSTAPPRSGYHLTASGRDLLPVLQGLLPQGQPERDSRVINMVAQQDAEGFGGCTNAGECTAVCPKGIPLTTIGRLNHDLLASLRGR